MGRESVSFQEQTESGGKTPTCSQMCENGDLVYEKGPITIKGLSPQLGSIQFHL